MGGQRSGGGNRKSDAQLKLEGRRPHPEAAVVIPFTGRTPRKPPQMMDERERSAWRQIVSNLPSRVSVDPVLLENYARLTVRLRDLGSRPLSPAETRFFVQMSELSRKMSVEIRAACERSRIRSGKPEPDDHMSQLLECLRSPKHARNLEVARQARAAGFHGDIDDLDDFIKTSGFKPKFKK